MIGQSFAPLSGTGKPRQAGAGASNSQAQQAIKVLNLRIPRVVGGGAPAPQPLLTSPGAGAVPMPGGGRPGTTPMGAPGGDPGMGGPAPFGLEEILKILFGQNPPAGGGDGGGKDAPTPVVHYAPLPGGTAGPGRDEPTLPFNPRRDTKNPFGSDESGYGKRGSY